MAAVVCKWQQTLAYETRVDAGAGLLTIYIVVVVHKCPIDFFGYDVNCKFSITFNKWLNDLAMSTPPLAWLALSKIKFPVPVWHAMAHVLSCQERIAWRRFIGAGRGVGEPPETAWSWMRPFNNMLQYMGRANRQNFINFGMLPVWKSLRQARLPGACMCHAHASEQRFTCC